MHAPTRPYTSTIASDAELSARTVRRRLDLRFRVASFSALLARERTDFGEVGLDRDALSEQAEREARELTRAPSTLTLDDFPRGTVAGQMVHEVLEHAEFDGDEAALAQIADRFVRARGYPEALVPNLVRGLWEAFHTPLDATGLCLAQLSRAARVDEMEFVFPVDSLLSPTLLERTFRAHKAPPALPSYASELRDLGFEALHGFMRGFIDLVFRHGDRFYVVDYKSNWLGASAADYEPSALARPMADHHYYLQYHLYVLAVHRHLRRRVRGYSFDTHFGGVFYLFLRGMAPAHPSQTGVFFDRPSRALVDALDQALSERSADLDR